MEIDKSKSASNDRVEMTFSGLETPILNGMLRPYSQVEADQEVSHVDSLLIDMCEQVHDANRDKDFVYAVKEEDLDPLMSGLQKLSKGYLAKIAMYGFGEDTELELMTVRNKLISSLSPDEETSPSEIEASFKPRDFADTSLVTLRHQ